MTWCRTLFRQMKEEFVEYLERLTKPGLAPVLNRKTRQTLFGEGACPGFVTCFWIIFAGSLRRSFSSRICWWSVGFETQRVRISTPLRVGSTTSIERMSDSSKSTLRGSLPSPALSVSSAGSIDLRAESTACWTPSRPASSSYPATQRLVALAPWPCDTTQPAPNRRAAVRFSFCSIGG